MAWSGATILNIRYGGSDTNGGGFVTGASGTNWSLQDAAQYTLTDGHYVSGTTMLLSEASSDMIGNIAYVAGGTGSITGNWYQITGQTTGTSITVDRSTGLVAGTGITVNIGGAFATPGGAAGAATAGAAGLRIGWKYNSSIYTLTTATAGSAGPITMPAFLATLEGYDIIIGDRTGNRPTLSWGSVSLGASTFAVTGGTSARSLFVNYIINGNSVSNGNGISPTARTYIDNCVIENCVTGVGSAVTTSAIVKQTAISGCTTGIVANSTAQVTDCSISTCTTGISSAVTVNNVLLSSCTTGLTTASGTQFFAEQCVFDSCTSIGADASSNTIGVDFVGCTFTNQSGVGGIGLKISTAGTVVDSCAFYNNTTDLSAAPLINYNPITLTQPPYTGGGQFAPNATAGGGASLRGAAPGVAGQTDNKDVGAVQHANPAGGGLLVNPGMSGGARG